MIHNNLTVEPRALVQAGTKDANEAGRSSPSEVTPAAGVPAAARKLYRKPRVTVLQPGTVGYAKARDAFDKKKPRP